MRAVVVLSFVLIHAAILATPANAQIQEKKCSTKVRGLQREIELETKPTYFIRVDTDLDRIYQSGECVLSLKDGKCVSHGYTWEPYPVSGLSILTIPSCGKGGNMCFYDSKTFQNKDDSVPFYVDKELMGYYQSVGFLKRSKDEATVRVVTYYGFFRDYKMKAGSVTPIAPVKKFCEGLDIKLPMLSKDGRKLSAWNVSKEKTIIYELSDDGSCKETDSLDFMVGKMDFSYDNQYAAFHASSDKAGDVSDSLELQQQIFVMDLKAKPKKITKLSFGADLIYYPHFGANGRLYALKFNKGADKYSVLEIDLKEALKAEPTEAGVCIDCKHEQQKKLFSLECID